MSVQKPLELILARNLLSSISTPAFLVGEDGELLFFNDAAAAMLGRRFEETGAMSPRSGLRVRPIWRRRVADPVRPDPSHSRRA